MIGTQENAMFHNKQAFHCLQTLYHSLIHRFNWLISVKAIPTCLPMPTIMRCMLHALCSLVKSEWLLSIQKFKEYIQIYLFQGGTFWRALWGKLRHLLITVNAQLETCLFHRDPGYFLIPIDRNYHPRVKRYADYFRGCFYRAVSHGPSLYYINLRLITKNKGISLLLSCFPGKLMFPYFR